MIRSFVKGCLAFETRNLELPPFWRTVEKQPPCIWELGNAMQNLLIPHVPAANDAPISIADGDENVPKKYSLHSPFELSPCYLQLFFFFWLSHFLAVSPAAIFVFPFQFAKVSSVFHALSQSLNLPFHTIQLSSVQLVRFGFGSVPL